MSYSTLMSPTRIRQASVLSFTHPLGLGVWEREVRTSLTLCQVSLTSLSRFFCALGLSSSRCTAGPPLGKVGVKAYPLARGLTGLKRIHGVLQIFQLLQ